MTAINFIEHPLTGTPFGFALDLCLVLAAAVWLLSVLTRDYSLVDNLWSLLPPAYCLIVAAHADFDSARVNVMTALVIAWSARLTFNHARKGGLRLRNMDYRWAYTREKLGPVGFQVLNITFIAPGQMLLIWLFTSPVHQAWLAQDAPLGWLDFIAAALFVVLFIGEATGDEQMWRFQQDKKKRLANGETVTEPFITTGLFRYCRHPSYFCELGMWWVFYLFAVAELDRVRRRSAHGAANRLDPHDGGDLRRQVPQLPRLPGGHLGAHPIAPTAAVTDEPGLV